MRPPLITHLLAAVALASAAPGVVAQNSPTGSEFQINTHTVGRQNAPALAFDAAGNFVVVWHSPQDGSRYGIFGQRFNGSAIPRGTEFQVNTYTPGFQGYAAVGSDALGNFVVVWASDCAFNQDGSSCGVFGQRFDPAGARQGTEFQVNTYTKNSQTGVAIATSTEGSFVVAWESLQDGSGLGVFAQRFNGNGTPAGTEFQVNTYTIDLQGSYPVAVAASPTQFVVAWNSNLQDGSSNGVFAQLFDTNGARLGSEFQVNTSTDDTQANPGVTMDPSGAFVIVWTSPQDGEATGIFAQRFTSNGNRAGTEFQVNSYTLGEQYTYPSGNIASDSAGNFVVVWASFPGDASNGGIFAQRFRSNGMRVGSEFQVNSYTEQTQNYPTVVSTGAGNFLVAWQSGTRDDGGQDGSRFGIFAQRFVAQPNAVPALGIVGLVGVAAGLYALGTRRLRRRRRG